MTKNKDIHYLGILSPKEIGETFNFRVPSNLEKKNIAYYSIILDLETCKESLMELRNNHLEVVQTSLFTTIIALYGKCFTDSSRKKFPKLETEIFNDSNSELKKFHSNLMDIRHNFIAHRGETELESAKAFVQIDPKNMGWAISVGIKRRFSFSSDEINNYLRLIEYLIDKTKEKYEKLGQKILIHIIDNWETYNLKLLNKITPELADYVMNLKPNAKTK